MPVFAHGKKSKVNPNNETVPHLTTRSNHCFIGWGVRRITLCTKAETTEF